MQVSVGKIERKNSNHSKLRSYQAVANMETTMSPGLNLVALNPIDSITLMIS